MRMAHDAHVIPPISRSTRDGSTVAMIRSGRDGPVAGLVDSGEHGIPVDVRGRGHDEASRLRTDVDAFDAGDLLDLFAHGHLAVAAGHPAHLELGGDHGLSSVPVPLEGTFIRVLPNTPHGYSRTVQILLYRPSTK